MSLLASDMPVKYTRTTGSTTTTIYEIRGPAGHGLCRITGTSYGYDDIARRFQVDVFLDGWTNFIYLDHADEVTTELEALQVLLDIQTPTTAEA